MCHLDIWLCQTKLPLAKKSQFPQLQKNNETLRQLLNFKTIIQTKNKRLHGITA